MLSFPLFEKDLLHLQFLATSIIAVVHRHSCAVIPPQEPVLSARPLNKFLVWESRQGELECYTKTWAALPLVEISGIALITAVLIEEQGPMIKINGIASGYSFFFKKKKIRG